MSGVDGDRRAVRYEFPDFVDFGIVDGDASLGPVSPEMEVSKVFEPSGKTVNHYAASGRDAAGFRPGEVQVVGIGNVERFVKPALLVMAVYEVCPFGSSTIPSHAFAAERVSPQGNVVGADYLVSLE